MSNGVHSGQYNIGGCIRTEHIQYIGQYVDVDIRYYRWLWLRFNLFASRCRCWLLLRNETIAGNWNSCVRFRFVLNIVQSKLWLKLRWNSNLIKYFLFRPLPCYPERLNNFPHRFWYIYIRTACKPVAWAFRLEEFQFDIGRIDFELRHFWCSDETIDVSMARKCFEN